MSRAFERAPEGAWLAFPLHEPSGFVSNCVLDVRSREKQVATNEHQYSIFDFECPDRESPARPGRIHRERDQGQGVAPGPPGQQSSGPVLSHGSESNRNWQASVFSARASGAQRRGGLCNAAASAASRP